MRTTGGATRFYQTGAIEWDPMIIIIGAVVLLVLLLILRKTGWPKL